MRRVRRRRTACLTALVLAVSIAGQATATEGGLYPYGSSIWATSPEFGATVLPGPVWQIQGAARVSSAVNHWEMNWGCPAPGSEIAAVRFGALRTQAPSSLAVQVTGDRRVLWQEGDAGMPQSPAGGRAYDVPLPGGQCNVHLALAQVETRNQHARGYFIDSPRILVRDLTAPDVALRALSGGWLNAGSRLRVDWTTTDNFGSDGVGLQSVIVGGQVRWTAAPGAGNHGLDLPLDDVGDGAHGVTVRADGDGTAAGSAGGTIHVDRTPPVVTSASASPGGGPGGVALSWTAADNLSGVGQSVAELNTAADGDTSGAWAPIATGDGPGAHALTATAAGVPDGMHAWRIRTLDLAGNTGVGGGQGRLAVDTTAPALEIHAVPTGWVRRTEIDMTVTDNLQDALGIGAVEIDVNAASDGGDSGAWQRRATSTGPAGRRGVPVDLAGLESGRHAVRVVARNGGPFGGALATERRALLRVDTVRPTISRLVVSANPDRRIAVAWTADDADAGVAAARVEWRDGTTWRILASEPARDGAGSMVIDGSALPAGGRALRLVIADGAGNEVVRADAVQIATGAGAASTAPDPTERLRTARLRLSVRGARVERRGGRAVLVRRVPTGGPVHIRGRLTDRAGRAIVGAEIQVRGHRGRVIGRSLTRRGGAFAIVARPLAGGPARVGVAVGRGLLPQRAGADVRLEVRPRVSASASATTVTAGARVLFTGRIAPAPGELGLGSRKGVVLEWLDPIRRTWRPVVNARIRRDGTFAIPWSFGVRGLTIPMRVSIPAEVGWPLLPVRSGVIRVRVGG